jgi:hypothetical protein
MAAVAEASTAAEWVDFMAAGFTAEDLADFTVTLRVTTALADGTTVSAGGTALSSAA